MAVGARGERSGGAGVNGNQNDNSNNGAGAVYVFTRNSTGHWNQQAYLKSSEPGISDLFGFYLAMDTSGDTLAVAT